MTIFNLLLVFLFAAHAVAVDEAPVLNEIDKCWRLNPDWSNQREQLANCSVGYAGKMTNNVGPDLTHYVVTDPGDHPVDPRPGTLRYGVAHIQGKVWITFQQDMTIKLEMPLLVGSYTTIDGRGASIQITGGGCLVLDTVTDVIIHGLEIYDCKAQHGGQVIGPEGKIIKMGTSDADAIRIMASTRVWIDHNTLYECEDGLADVTQGSTNITISNNWFRSQDKVMLLGHDDEFEGDKIMKVTVMYNNFGPDCVQRMPRVRHGYAHVANNIYNGWGLYAIGGSMNPTIKSQANLFIAPEGKKKEVTWIKENGDGTGWTINSVEDVLENGATFQDSKSIGGGGPVEPNYTPEQLFQVAPATSVKSLTRCSGVLKCPTTGQC